MRAPRTDISGMSPSELKVHRAAVNKRKSAKYYAAHREEIVARRAGNRREEGEKYRAKDGVLEMRKEWRLKNIERDKENKRNRYLKNKASVIAAAGRWRLANPEKAALHRYVQCAKRQATIGRSTPAWANSFFIREAYDLARRRNRLTNIKWHVDHIVPIRSKMVCGLHVENNLRVVPDIVNRQKSNRFWPDMPEVEVS